MKRSTLAAVAALAAVAVGLALASQTVSWRTVGAEEMKKARIESLVLDPEGRVTLGPARAELGRWDDAGAWCLAVGDGGETYVGTGDEGKVHRVGASPSAKSDLLADLPELEVHALAVLPGGRLLAGTSPDGSVHAIGKGSARTGTWFDPEDRYIWAIAPLESGEALVATGDKARLYRVDATGRGTVLYESPDPHLRSLAAGPDGAVFVGTSGRGLVLAVDRRGKARVLVDSKRQEIVALALDNGGNLYAAAVGEPPSPASLTIPAETPTSATATATVTVMAEAPPEVPAESGKMTAEARPAGAPVFAGAAAALPGAEIWKVEPDGFARVIWSTRTETVYALAADAERGGVYVGTGPDGSLYRLDQEGRASWLGKFEGGPISALASSRGRLLVLGATPPRLRALGPALADSGTIDSKVFDARLFAVWGRLRWVLDPARAPGVTLSVRSGNTEEPDATWSDWSRVVAGSDPAEEGPVGAPPGRFVQWSAAFKRPSNGSPPALSEVELRLRPRNVAPRIENLAVLPPGVAYQLQPSGGQPGTDTPFLANRYADDVMRYLAGGRRPPPNVRRFFLSGVRTVGWDGADENGDEIQFDVWISGRDEERWRPLARSLGETFLTWDSRSVEDGWYRIRVVGSDGVHNPGDETKTGEKLSEPFVVDNTPPTLAGLDARRSGRAAQVQFRASDTAGRISYAEYAIDAGQWRVLLPEDRVEDSRTETYRFEVDLPDERSHVVVVRVADEGGNWASQQTVIGK